MKRAGARSLLFLLGVSGLGCSFPKGPLAYPNTDKIWYILVDQGEFIPIEFDEDFAPRPGEDGSAQWKRIYAMDRGWMPVENIGHFVTSTIEVKRSFLIFRYVDECLRERDVIAKELGKTGVAGMTEEPTLKKRIAQGKDAEFWISQLPPHRSRTTTMPVNDQGK